MSELLYLQTTKNCSSFHSVEPIDFSMFCNNDFPSHATSNEYYSKLRPNESIIDSVDASAKIVKPKQSIHSSELYYKNLILNQSILSKLTNYTEESHTLGEGNHNQEKLAVIMDTRFDDLMENVINNFMFFMKPRGWNLMIISHSKYESQIREKYPFCIFGKIEEDLIFYDENQIPNISIQTYNRILLSPYFWNSLQGEHIAIFQKDCIMYNMFDEIFLNYDFAGANTYLPHIQTFFNGMINGGFSLRKKTTMLECLEKINCQKINNYISTMKKFLNFSTLNFPPQSTDIFSSSSTLFSGENVNCESIAKNNNIYDKYTLENINEDVFFSFACEILQKKIPDIENRKKLSIEFENSIYFNTVPNKDNLPAVYHGWNKNYHSLDAAKYFISFSPYFN